MALMQEPHTRVKLAQELNQLLADTYVLFTKTQNFHWNIVDPRFFELHKLFEAQYRELLEQTDEIAERTRTLGIKSAAGLRVFLDNSTLDEAPNDLSGDEMIRHLALDHETISKWLRTNVKKAQDLGDEGTADLYIQHMRAHDKQAWMLRSHLENRI